MRHEPATGSLWASLHNAPCVISFWPLATRTSVMVSTRSFKSLSTNAENRKPFFSARTMAALAAADLGCFGGIFQSPVGAEGVKMLSRARLLWMGTRSVARGRSSAFTWVTTLK